MLNYVNRFLVGKATGAVNTGATLQTLAKGDILIIDGVTSAPITTKAGAAAAKSIRIAMGTGNVKLPILSSPITRETITAFTKQAYAPAVAQVDTFADLKLAAGKEYKIIIVFKDDLRLIANRQTRVSIHHSTPSTGFVIATEVQKIVDKVNASRVAGTLLTAASDGVDGLTLTGKPIPTESINDYEFVSFESTFVEVDPNGVSTSGLAHVPGVTTTKAFGGSGLPAQLAYHERYANGYLGQNDLRDFRTNKDVKTFVSDSVTGGGYDVIHVLHQDIHTGDIQFKMSSPLQTTICLAASSAQATAVEGLLNDFVAGKESGATVGTTNPTSPAGE